MTGRSIIAKKNRFEEYEAIKGIREAREKKLEMTADALIEENMEAFLELAK